MSGVKRYDAHYLAEGVMGGKALASAEMVLASDYDRDTQALREDRDSQQRAGIDVMAERDALRAQVEVMRAALCKFTSLGIVSCNWDEMDDALRHANAALQVEP